MKNNIREPELKAGDVVSFVIDGTDKWVCRKVNAVYLKPTVFHKPYACIFNRFVFLEDEGKTWQRGVHISLLPEGFALIEQCTIDTTNELNGAYMHGMGRMYDELEAFRDIVAQQASQLIAAQKEKDSLEKSVIRLRADLDLAENEKILYVEVYKRRGFGNGEIFLLWNNGIHRFSKMDLDAIALFRRPRL